MRKVILVEDNKELSSSIQYFLSLKGYTVSIAPTKKDMLRLMDNDFFPVAIVDKKLPDGNPLELLLNRNNETKIVVITGFPDSNEALSWLKKGVEYYLVKPFSLEELYIILERIFQKIEDERRKIILASQNPPFYIGSSKASQKLMEEIKTIAEFDVPVLITGETGSGKEVVAKMIHNIAPRREGPFLVVNCTAIPDNLIESELFGYQKGAFTGAHQNKQGIFELANGGTLVLDEIGDLPLHLQPKFLHVIENNYIQRLGDTKKRRIDVRIIALTNKDLLSLKKSGSFREDLYFRLSVVHIRVPPLRERMEDIPGFIEYYLQKFNKLYHRNVSMEKNLIESLKNYCWPGNIRELKNFIERYVIYNGKTPLPSQDSDQITDLNIPLLSIDEMKKILVKRALEQTNWDKRKSAEILDISLSSLKRYIKKFNLSKDSSN
ncbi:MAG TPA: sigma-54-dependent Fis family transcriptional regulator [bacterium]|nr:sigma-54-dependent Fis family transcriptional regulator [bacterium]